MPESLPSPPVRDDQDQSIDSISSDSEDQQPISPHYPASRFEQWVWNCPLPPPGALAQYEETLPGAADRLLKMIETESSHRRDMESRQLESEIRETRWGAMDGILYRSGYHRRGGLCRVARCTNSRGNHRLRRSDRAGGGVYLRAEPKLQ